MFTQHLGVDRAQDDQDTAPRARLHEAALNSVATWLRFRGSTGAERLILYGADLAAPPTWARLTVTTIMGRTLHPASLLRRGGYDSNYRGHQQY